MSPSMEKARIDHQVLNSIFSGTEPDRNTLAQYQIRLAAFFGISVYKRLERCVGTHPEKLWVKIPNYFCLSAYHGFNVGSCWIPGFYILRKRRKHLIFNSFPQGDRIGRDPRGKPVKTICYGEIDPLRPWNPT